MSEKYAPSNEGPENNSRNSRPFGLLGRVPVAFMIGGGATAIGALPAEAMGDSPWGVVVAGGIATITATVANRQNLNDPLEQSPPSEPPMPEVAMVVPDSPELVRVPDVPADSTANLE